ncbi:hypothetical protein, partial [Muricoccus vinaceus]
RATTANWPTSSGKPGQPGSGGQTLSLPFKGQGALPDAVIVDQSYRHQLRRPNIMDVLSASLVLGQSVS